MVVNLQGLIDSAGIYYTGHRAFRLPSQFTITEVADADSPGFVGPNGTVRGYYDLTFTASALTYLDLATQGSAPANPATGYSRTWWDGAHLSVKNSGGTTKTLAWSTDLSSYLPLAGGTVTGVLTLSSLGTALSVTHDANIGGGLGVTGNTALTGWLSCASYIEGTAIAAPAAPSAGLSRLFFNSGNSRWGYINNGGSAITFVGATDIIDTQHGGTGLSSWTAGDLPYYASGTTLSKLAAGTTSQVLIGGTSPSWGAVSLSGSMVSGALPATKGGTGQTAYTGGDMLYASSTTALSKVGIGAAGTFLQSAGTGGVPPVWANAHVRSLLTTGTTSYTVPAGCVGLLVRMRAQGGGGGSGARQASGSQCSGGAGGGNGALSWAYIPATGSYAPGSSVTVSIPNTGGTGGAAQSTNSTAGNAGTDGSDVVFGTLIARGGKGGSGGGLGTAATGGQGGIGTVPGGSGATATNGTAGVTGATITTNGGSTGGGINSTPTAFAGGAGPLSGDFNGSAATAGTVSGGTGGNGADGSADGVLMGMPGAGGGSNTGGAGGDGGNGGKYGAGGGGGGSALNGSNSGKGGNGGEGVIEVIALF